MGFSKYFVTNVSIFIAVICCVWNTAIISYQDHCLPVDKMLFHIINKTFHTQNDIYSIVKDIQAIIGDPAAYGYSGTDLEI